MSIYIKLKDNNIEFINFQPFDERHGLGKTREELLLDGIFVDQLPQPELFEGKISIIKYGDIGLYYEYIDEPITLDTKVQNIMDKQSTAQEKYAATDKSSVLLINLKKLKMAQLDEACNMAIVNGFKHVIGTTEYLFSCSLSAQSNFTGTDLLFKDGFITQAEWSAVDVATNVVERVILNQTDFNTVKLKVFQHINSNISKFRNTLQTQVEAAVTVAEVDAVKW